jgi:hypothetical protein
MSDRLGFDMDSRPQERGWYPGGYMSTCDHCDKFFIGGKRAFHCAPCAYSGLIPYPTIPDWRKEVLRGD